MEELNLKVVSLLLLVSYTNGCFFEVNGDPLESLMVTEGEVDFTVIAEGSCELTVLAVGGGERGYGSGGLESLV